MFEMRCLDALHGYEMPVYVMRVSSDSSASQTQSLLFFYHAASLSPSLLLSNHHTCITHAKPSDGINISTCTFPIFETPFKWTSAYAGASMRDSDGAIHVLLNCFQDANSFKVWWLFGCFN